MARSSFSIKLLIDKKSNRVLFAEVGKEVTDFLFGLLSLPIGSVIKHLTKKRMVGCIGNLYGSVESLNETYLLPNQNKDSLLNPISVANVPLLTSNELKNVVNYYTCSNYHCRTSGNNYVTDGLGVSCSGCRNNITSRANFIASGGDKGASSTFKGGFVKEVVTYMVMDDLVVKPMSTISSITLLNNFNVDSVSSLQEKVVDFGMEKGLDLLEASFQTSMVLTQVFLVNNAKRVLQSKKRRNKM